MLKLFVNKNFSNSAKVIGLREFSKEKAGGLLIFIHYLSRLFN
jgi:hypothetical protein